MTTTYVLAGADPEGSLTDANTIFAQDPNCVMIYAQPGQSIRDAVRAIKPPANIILNCHGVESNGEGNGTFGWRDIRDTPSYAQLFAALKALPDGGKGIESVTISSCYGGLAEKENILAAAPSGMLIQSMTGPHTPNDGPFVTNFARNAHRGGNSTEFFIEALSAFDPERYRQDAVYSGGRIDTNPEHALPHILGVGGNPPLIIDLDTEMGRVFNDKAAPVNPAAWDAAIRELRDKFGITSSDPVTIDSIAEKMKQGQTPEGAGEKRIAYALTAAYLDKSGELAYWVEATKKHSQQTLPIQQFAQQQPQQPYALSAPPQQASHPYPNPDAPIQQTQYASTVIPSAVKTQTLHALIEARNFPAADSLIRQGTPEDRKFFAAEMANDLRTAVYRQDLPSARFLIHHGALEGFDRPVQPSELLSPSWHNPNTPIEPRFQQGLAQTLGLPAHEISAPSPAYVQQPVAPIYGGYPVQSYAPGPVVFVEPVVVVGGGFRGGRGHHH